MEMACMSRIYKKKTWKFQKIIFSSTNIETTKSITFYLKLRKFYK